LVDFANVPSMLESSIDDDIVNIDCCVMNENVCHGREGADEEFSIFIPICLLVHMLSFPLTR